jgi:hypothetical protein
LIFIFLDGSGNSTSNALCTVYYTQWTAFIQTTSIDKCSQTQLLIFVFVRGVST